MVTLKFRSLPIKMPSDNQNIILAIDPGRDKLGLAVLDADGGIIEKSVIQRDDFPDAISEIINRLQPSLFAIGDGTGSDWVFNATSATVQGKVVRIPEMHTTLEARELAWKESPPGGIFRILPKIFWPIPPDLDAWAAVVIGRRAIEKQPNS